MGEAYIYIKLACLKCFPCDKLLAGVKLEGLNSFKMGMNEREEHLRANIEAQLNRKKACERRAMQLVYQMLEAPSVDEKTLKSAARCLNPDYYDDITVERGLAKMCGYPVCPNPLAEELPRQKYHVSTLTNTVFDIQERLNFCSNQCFKASKYYAQQLGSDPLWTREDDADVLEIFLLDRAKINEKAAAASGHSIQVEGALFGGDKINIGNVKSPSAPKQQQSQQPATPPSDAYKNLVGEAKLEMIRHLLFDKEDGLKSKMDEVKEEEKKEERPQESNDENQKGMVKNQKQSDKSKKNPNNANSKTHPIPELTNHGIS